MKIVSVEIGSETRFHEVLKIWVEKPQTILKCVSCSTIEKIDGKIFRSLHPKKSEKEILTEEILSGENFVKFQLNETDFYQIKIKSGTLTLEFHSQELNAHPAVKFEWLRDVLLPKLAKFMNDSENNRLFFFILWGSKIEI